MESAFHEMGRSWTTSSIRSCRRGLGMYRRSFYSRSPSLQSRYLLPPPLAGLAALTDTAASTDSPFRIWSGTNYDDLFYRVETVGVILTDVQQYDKSAEDLDHILTNLDSIHGRIG